MVVFSSFSALSLFLVLRDDVQDEVWVFITLPLVILKEEQTSIPEFSLIVGSVILALSLPKSRKLNHVLPSHC